MDKEFKQYSRTMAEDCTKEQLVDLYIAEVETCVEVEEQLRITEKAFKLAIFELDFYKNHSQTTNQETIERIEKLTDDIWNKAKEKK